ncbi:MAG: PAS domain S-box protein [Prolixibacteraceae bacterium]
MGNNKRRLTEKQLLLENEELHWHVYELEETLNSIRNGEIDAIIVSGVDGDNIYSLTSVETKYRIIIEEMYEGAITLTKDGLITYCNARFAELVSEPCEKIIGTYFVNLLQESEVRNFLGLFKTGLSGRSVGELIYLKNNGHALNLHLSISVLPEVLQNGVCVLFSDITELKRQEEELISLNAQLEDKVAERTAELGKTIENLINQKEATTKLSEELLKAKNDLEARNEELEREVSERRLAEEKLIQIKRRFEAILLQSPSNGVIYKLIRDDAGNMVDWEITDINELGAESIGLERETALGKRVLELFGEQVMAPYFETARQVIASGTPQTIETYFEFNKRYYLSSVFLVDPDHYANMSIDITDLKRSQENVAYQALLLENINDAVIATDEQYRITHWNKAAELIYGWEAKEVLGKHAIQILQAEFEGVGAELMRYNMAEMGKWMGEVSHMRKNGNRFSVEVSSLMLHDNEGKRTGYVSVNRDITERKLSELKVIESEHKFKNLIWDMNVGVLLQGPKSEILISNPKALELLGMNEDQLLGKSSLDPDWNVIHEDGSPFPGNTHPVPQAIESRLPVKGVSMGVYNPSKGERLWLFVDAMPQLNDDGTVRHVVCTFVNITQQKQTEAELSKAKTKAEESDRLKSAFLANMSHEIRTPMNGILGFAELLRMPELTGMQQQEYIAIIEKSGKRMLNIINDIVDISKIESGLMRVEIVESNINDQIEYLYTFFKPECETKRIQLITKNALPSSQSIIQTDREKVFAILTNLIKNAIKYSHQGVIEFGYVKKSNELEFFVKDEGIGIPKDRQDAIFERFIQADIEDRNAYQGAGLGLTIAKSYVELLGGKIRAESEEGKGSKFYFTLPYIHEIGLNKMVEINNHEKNDNQQINQLKILIAEDDKISKKLISVFLKPLSKELLFAKTGREAVEICRNNPDIDLVLMDIQMPLMNGYEATSQIREFNKQVVVIAQTAFGLVGDREKALKAGCNDHISKPIEFNLLMERIKKQFA